MFHRARLVQICRPSIRSLTQYTSSLSGSRLTVAKNEPSVNSRSLFCVARSIMKRNQQVFVKFDSAGSRLSVRRIIGVSVAYGIANSLSGVAFAMNENEHEYMSATSYGNSVIDRDQLERWAFVKKVWIPSLFLVNVVLMSWNSPIELAIKIILALLSTKPHPLSIYIYIDQLCDQYRPRHPWSFYSQHVRAKNVDVTDYMLFCVGRVVVTDQEYTLVGVLGSWWVWPSHLKYSLQFQAGFDEIRSRARERLTYSPLKPATPAP
ncbi:hypothetical protein QQ045_021523 [Rhodiola kirilowii]